MPTIIDRTWRVQLFTDLGTDPRIEFLRERVKTYEDGDVLRSQLPTVARSLKAIADQPLPGGPRKLATLGDLAALIAECGHALAAEDAAAAAKRLADEEAARRAAEKAARKDPA
jgi:hypothetical protein